MFYHSVPIHAQAMQQAASKVHLANLFVLAAIQLLSQQTVRHTRAKRQKKLDRIIDEYQIHLQLIKKRAQSGVKKLNTIYTQKFNNLPII